MTNLPSPDSDGGVTMGTVTKVAEDDKYILTSRSTEVYFAELQIWDTQGRR